MGKRRSGLWSTKRFKKVGRGFLALLWKTLPWGFAFGLIGFFSLNVKHMLHADPYFQVEVIKVFPSGVLTESEHQFLEAQTRGRSLFDINLKEISRHLERNPKVKRAEAVRSLPKQLRIFIATRSPFIQIQLKEGGPYYLAASDQLVLSVQSSPRPDLAVLEDFGSAKKSYSVGSLYQNKDFYLLFDLLETLKTDPLLGKQNVSKLRMDQLGNLTLILQDGIELRFGRSVSLSESARVVLRSLLNSEDRNEILYMDLRYRDMIIKKKS
jgi:cell division septal protein FtsQ